MLTMRPRRVLSVAVVVLVSVALGGSASAAPQAKGQPAHRPVVISHLMSSCGDMDGI